jgi:hypothetical protein
VLLRKLVKVIRIDAAWLAFAHPQNSRKRLFVLIT